MYFRGHLVAKRKQPLLKAHHGVSKQCCLVPASIRMTTRNRCLRRIRKAQPRRMPSSSSCLISVWLFAAGVYLRLTTLIQKTGAHDGSLRSESDSALSFELIQALQLDASC